MSDKTRELIAENNRLIAERDHLLAMVDGMREGLSMHPIPDFSVWWADMVANGWLYDARSKRWGGNYQIVSVDQALEFYAIGQTPPPF